MKPKPTLFERARRMDLIVTDRGPFAYSLSAAVHYGVRVALGQRVDRSRSQIFHEYDGRRGEWFRDDLAVEELIYGNPHARDWVLLGDRLVLGTQREAREAILDTFAERVQELTGGSGTVVEFGAGTGRNLFFLARRFPELRLIGIELTPNSVSRAQAMAEAAGVEAEFRVGDIRSPNLAADLPDDVAVCYSMHCLEQLPHDFPPAVDTMLRVAGSGVLFFEPVHELFSRDVRGFASRLRVRNANYLDGLLGYLKRLGANIVSARRLGLASNPLNETCEIVVRS